MANGQTYRHTAYSFLNVPSARIAALGGVNVSLADRDPNAFLGNPALTGDTLAGFASASHQFYVGDIGHSVFTYLPKTRYGVFAIGVQHMSYGTIPGYDVTGAPNGEFTAGETAIVISKNYQVRYFRFGVSIKGAFSSIGGYRSSALLADLGGVFIHPDQDFKVGLTFRNLGFVMSNYSPAENISLPFDVQLGTTFKPAHMPFRFSVTVYRLTDSEAVEYTGGQPEVPGTLGKVFRHFNFATELLLHRNVNLLLGYNYGIRQEMKLENLGGSAGFSAGFSARIKSFEFVFSRSTYVIGSAAYSLTLSADLNRIRRVRQG